jgi:multidrug efflux pump subunit AcrB
VAIAQTALPAGISLDLGGESAQAEEIIGSFLKTLGLSLLCIFVLLLVLFRSLLDTVVVIASLPLCIVGAMLGLLVTQADFGMVSLLGIIFLLGLTNKNAILIVDYIKQLRASGLSGREAILQGAPVRLRPILMTTAATVLGMLPLALGFGAGFELRVPMAIAIMGGLITSTLLSLLVVPVLYDGLASASRDDRSKKPQSTQ